MDKRVYNFSAGPSQLPVEVLEKAQSQMMNYNGSGMSVMEMSHRSKTYQEIFDNTKALLKEVMHVPDNYEILFLHGGATQQFSMIPLNLLKTGKADYSITGNFANLSYKEACKFGNIHVAYDGSGNNFSHIPTQDELDLSDDADYLHICANNTIYGVEYHYDPVVKNGYVVADMSSNILSKKVDVSKYGMIYAGAQKNMGIAGLGVCIVRKDLLEGLRQTAPILMDYKLMADKDSMYNTPSTWAIYMCGLVLEWVKDQGGVEEMEKRSNIKSKMLYDYLDQSSFYKPLADKSSRSRMNVVFTTPSKELDELFVKESIENNMTNLKGHRVLGGIRASIYNAMSIEGVEHLLGFMKQFEEKYK